MTPISRRLFVAGGAVASALSGTRISTGSEDLTQKSRAVDMEFPYSWRVSFDDGYTFGDACKSREEAIALAGESYEGATIAECQQQSYDLTLFGSQILELLEGQNEEIIGEGEFIYYTPEQETDLGKMVSATIATWATKHNIDTAAWQFGDVRNAEIVGPSEETIAQIHNILNDMTPPIKRSKGFVTSLD